MRTLDKPLEYYDEASGQVWEIPRRRVTSVFAEVEERWVANFVVPEKAVKMLVRAPFLEPIKVNGRFVLSLCAIFMRHAAPEWAPLNLGPASKNCALRIACRDTRDGSLAVWVDHRYSDSRVVEVLSKLGFPEVIAGLRVTEGRDFYGRKTLDMTTDDSMIDLRLVEYEETERVDNSVFKSLDQFEEYFGSGIRSFGPGSKKGSATIVDLHKRSDNRFEDMSHYFGYLRSEFGNWPVDSVYRTREGLYEWRYEGDVSY